MTVEPKSSRFKQINDAIVARLSYFAIWALAAMMFLTFASVLLRYVFNSPIHGAMELIEFLMAIVVPFSIVYCAKQKGHIGVDFILENFTIRTRKVLEVFVNFLMVVLYVPIFWQIFLSIFDEFKSNLTSPVLYIPVFPFIAVVALAFLILVLIAVEHLVSSLLEIVK